MSELTSTMITQEQMMNTVACLNYNGPVFTRNSGENKNKSKDGKN